MHILFLQYLALTLHYTIYSMSNVFIFLLSVFNDIRSYSIASSLSPEDPEIAFNLAAVLEASKLFFPLLFDLL